MLNDKKEAERRRKAEYRKNLSPEKKRAILDRQKEYDKSERGKEANRINCRKKYARKRDQKAKLHSSYQYLTDARHKIQSLRQDAEKAKKESDIFRVHLYAR